MLERNKVIANPEVSRHVKEWRGGAKYNKVCTIGKGAFATVYMISAKFDGTCYAAKELEKRRFIKNGVLDQKVDTELKIMKKIKHVNAPHSTLLLRILLIALKPNIVQYIEHVDWDDYFYLIMDYVPFGDLGNLISQRGKLPEETVKSMASQLLSALKYLHKLGITHRDVKPDNILIQNHDPFHAKLTDFGLSKMIDNDETFLQTFCGTLLYCAPEVYSEYQEYDRNGQRTLRSKGKKALPRQRYSQAVDLWSLAGVIFYALSGSPPYPAKTGTTHQQLLNSIMSKPLDIRPLRLASVSEEGIQFVRSMLQVRPESRPSISQLQSALWLTGIDETISNVDDDEVDMIGEVGEEEGIEQSASQLSIQETIIEQIYDADEQEGAKPSRETRDMENPSSFVTVDSSSSESFAVARNPRGNARLFGEVSASALGSSGVIPQEHLNLPVPPICDPHRVPNANYLSISAYTQSEPEVSSVCMGEPIPRPARSTALDATTSAPKRGQTAPSLFGAESLVGQLQMNSPSPSPFLDPGVSSTGPLTPGIQESIDNLRRSLRHPREDKADPEEDRPAPKRVKSSREIDIPLSKTIYWDPRDKSTWHDDYPVMMNSQYNEAAALAKEHGEEFQHGGKIFDALVGSYRKRASEERATQAETRRTSIVEQGRETLMMRDERRLEEKDREDAELPQTSHGDSSISGPVTLQSVAPKLPPATAEPNKGQEFKHPRRILGKFIATPDSVIPSLVINVTEDITSWGRGLYNTIVHPEANEDRIPKYAFKLILWKPDLEASANRPSADSLSFWIATKARAGIHVNGVHVRTHDRIKRYTPCKYWGEVRHGDMVTVWTRYNDPNLFLRFRFECYFSASQIPRSYSAPFTVLPASIEAEEIDRYCERKEIEWEHAAAKANEEQARLEAASSNGGSSRTTQSPPLSSTTNTRN
jgi:serine/threonine protein kinase